MGGRTIGAGIAAALVLTGLAGVPAPDAAAAPALATTYTQAALVQAIPVAPPLGTGYKGVEQFIPKSVANKRDRKGCILRQRMLIALATKKPRVGKGCRMTGGVWTVSGGTKKVTSPKGLVVAPVIPYRLAWGAGAYAWTPAQRLAWATNTGAGVGLRAKSVATQATQTVLSYDDLGWAINTIDSVEGLQRSFVDTCATDSAKCFSFLSWYTLNATNLVSSATRQCATLGQMTANLKAWGLTWAGWMADVASLAAQYCNGPISVLPEAPRYGIVPATDTSAVPANWVPVRSPLFPGYPGRDGGTDPIGGEAFGVLAPVDWPAPQVSAGALRLWDAGVSWRQIEKAKGQYDWRTLDATLARAQGSFQRVMYVLGDTPAWANGGKAGSVPPTNPGDAADFVRALCQRYQGSIAQYQAWNEGNILDFWTGTAQELATLTTNVKQAVDGCYPAAEVVAASAGARAEGGFATRYRDYLLALRDEGWPVEAFSVHSYPRASEGPMQRVGILQQWRAMLELSGAPEVPLYDTEINYGLAGLGEARVAIDDAKGAAWISQTMIQSIQYGIDAQYWFLWTGANPYDKLGIQLYAQTPLAIGAWNRTRDLLRFSRMLRCAQQDNLVGCQFTAPDNLSQYTVAWSVDGDATLLGAGTLGSSACSLVDGSCRPVAAGSDLAIGAAPVVLR